MKGGYIGSIIGIFIMIIISVVTPMYYIGIIEWARDETEAIYDARQFIDTVIDTRVVTDDMLADLNLAMAAKSTSFSAKIIRERQLVNPDPAKPGETYTSYVVTDDIYNWKAGDRITIELTTVGGNAFLNVAKSFLGFMIPQDEIILSGRVR